MARTSTIVKEKKKAKTVAKYAVRRAALKKTIKDPKTSDQARWEATQALQKQPRNASASRGNRRCELTGRPKGVFRRFGLSRNKLRLLAMRGDLPGVTKASW